MRPLRLLPAIILIALLWILSHPIGALPAIGTMLDPVNGMMAAAEPVDKDFNANLKLTGVQAPVEVWFEDRLVPHVRAQNDHDLYFTQGYIHAYFRLWQMDMQTRAAGGRVSEVAGEKALEFDRGQRRKGMVRGAEASLKAMEADPRTRDMLNAYRDGINAYIAMLNFRELPIEYKLMGFRPEQWTNLRSALLLKYMADDLTGKTDDIAFTLLRDQLGEEQFNYLFPERIPGSKPVIPEGTKFNPPSLKTPPVPEGEIWAHFDNAPGKAKAPSRPPPKGEEVLGKHLAYQTATVLGMFPTCHLPPSVGACKGTRVAHRDGGLVQHVVDSLEVRNAGANVQNAAKHIGDGEKHFRNASANNGAVKKHVGDAEKHIRGGAANIRNGVANIGNGENFAGDGAANVCNGVADIGNGGNYVRDGAANVSLDAADIRSVKANIGAGAVRTPCHPELFKSWFNGAHHDMKRGAESAGSVQSAVCSPASETEASGTTCFEPLSNCERSEAAPTTLQPSSNGSDDPDVAVGSNNWAISGQHTASGKPILCNDPHLGLNLPSLWFEMQLTAPGINTYGVSLPGAPGIVIGYNETISWGFTNNYRDVKDFYKISASAGRAEKSRFSQGRLVEAFGKAGYRSYEFPGPGSMMPLGRNIERISVKGKPDYLDTVLYTIHGPVMYDPSFPDPAKTGALLACTWMAHRGTNEPLALYLVNRAGDYETFTQAIQHFECPAQNFVYADVAGNIAMWGQGRFINKWKGQGRFVMNGSDSSTLWGESIPMSENPHVLNPPQGYVASANQQVTDSTYPYWYNGNFTEWRSWEINEKVSERVSGKMSAESINDPAITIEDQMKLQNDNFSLLYERLAEIVIPGLVADSMLAPALSYDHSDSTPGWVLQPQSEVSTFYHLLWREVSSLLWQSRFSKPGIRSPGSERTLLYLENLAGDSTAGRSDAEYVLTSAFKRTLDSVETYRSSGLQWYQVKNTSLTHLAKLPAFSYDHLKIGGWGNTINAVSGNHGPSWRMIVEMDSVPKAYAIYPGGQSGNPGSKHYGDNVQQWVDGKYNELRFLPRATAKNPFRYTWMISG